MTNYFELYNLSLTFHPDPAAVKSKFYELSRIHHPDRFVQADEHEKIESLRIAAINNDAYKVLSNSDKTMGYILTIGGLLEEEEKYSLPPDFLMEMMDLNEAISDFELEPDNDRARQQANESLHSQLAQWNEDVEKLIKSFDESGTSKELLLQIKDYYFRKKYLLRIKERIDKFAAH
jgi:molecular chaperone HscB